MKITKFVHSCLLVETSTPVARTVLFDPGIFSEGYLQVDALESLDDIFITHEHSDHLSINLVKKLVQKFPNVQITTTNSVVTQLEVVGIKARATETEGVAFFSSPHEGHPPMFNPPDEVGIHFLDQLSHPGDSHSFNETKDILALPVTGPWGSVDSAVQVALKLRPSYILPVHDWHWKDEVRIDMYERLEDLFNKQGITFFKLESCVPILIK